MRTRRGERGGNSTSGGGGEPADQIWPTSNRSPSLDLFGPGSPAITSLAPSNSTSSQRGRRWRRRTWPARALLLDAVPGSSQPAVLAAFALDRAAGHGARDARLPERGLPASGTYRPLAGDFNGDGRDDVFWYARGTAQDWLWRGAPDRQFTSARMTVNGTYSPVVGNLDGDQFDDIFWYAPGLGADAIWWGTPTGFTGQASSVAGTYVPLVGDYTGEGATTSSGTRPAPPRTGCGSSGRPRGSFTPPGSHQRDVHTVRRDFDADQFDDIFWYAARTREGPRIYYYGAGANPSPESVSVNGTYRPLAVQIDGAYGEDVFWHLPGSGADALLAGPRRALGGSPAPPGLSPAASSRSPASSTTGRPRTCFCTRRAAPPT